MEQQVLTEIADIENWLKTNDITKYTILNDGSVNVDGDVFLILKDCPRFLPVKFHSVTGNFVCSDGPLSSLQGSPEQVGGQFSCGNTEIVSLKGGPKIVGADYICSQTNIQSLEGGPTEVGGMFACGNTKITSLAHGPKKVKGRIAAPNTLIASYRNVQKYVDCESVLLTDSPVPGLICWILVPNIHTITFIGSNTNTGHLASIFNKHITTKDILGLQEDLIDAGFPEWAKL